MLGEQLSACINAGNKAFSRMTQRYTPCEVADDCAPLAVVQMARDAFIDQDLDITLSFADKNQYAGAVLGVVQFLFKKLTPRQITGPPMPDTRWYQSGGDRRHAKDQTEKHKTRPLQHQQGINLQAAYQEVHQCWYQQGDQAGPQQWDVTVVIRTRGQHGDNFGVGVLFGTGHRVSDLLLLLLR